MGCALSLSLLALMGRGCYAAEDDPIPPPQELATTLDSALRITLPVMVGGQGPFRFVIDTGADRTALSRGLAERLMLAPSNTLRMHELNGVTIVESVIVPTLTVAPDVVINHIKAPLLPEQHLGADGLLGLDSLHGQKVTIDFQTQTATLTRSPKKRGAPDDKDAIIVTARSRFGQLILVDAETNARRISVVLDTGAQNTIGNDALRRIANMAPSSKNFQPIDVISVTGKSSTADLTVLPSVRIGGFSLTHTPIAFLNAHSFDRFGLTNRPAMLLGMDVLRLFRCVTIDFTNRRISFYPPGAKTAVVGCASQPNAPKP